MLFVIGGASGAGKTACLPGLRRRFPDFAWHDFDERGVPDPIPGDWRVRTTEGWLQTAMAHQRQGRHTGLCGGAIYGELLACPSAPEVEGIRFCLLDCQDVVRVDRLRARGREEPDQDTLNWASWQRLHAADPGWRPDVITARNAGFTEMRWDRWADWHRGDPRWQVRVIDTTELSVEQAEDAIAGWIEQGLDSAMAR